MSDRSRRMLGLAAAMVVVASLSGAARAQSSAASMEPMILFDGSMRPMVVDPLAAQMLSTTGVPMTRAEAGLSAAASMQRMTGIGSGRISGVRGAAPGTASPGRASATLRAPGGQASVYFNRFGGGTSTSVSAPASRATTRNYYNRPAGFFPSGVR